MKPDSSQFRDISRKISGIGIICGLEIFVQSDCSLKLTEGYGITSKGILLHHPAAHFTYVRPYSHKIKGLSVEDPDIEVELWELTTVKSPGCKPLTPQKLNVSAFFKGKVAILYLEDTKSYTLKLLAIDQEVLEDILIGNMGVDQSCLEDWQVEADDISLIAMGREEETSGQRLFFRHNRNTSLQPIELIRFGFASADMALCDPANHRFAVSDNTFEAFFAEYEMIILDAIDQLQDRIRVLHRRPEHDGTVGLGAKRHRDKKRKRASAFSGLFPAQQRRFVSKYVRYLGKRWNDFSKDGEKKYYVQYFFDFVRDLVNTYNEMIDEISRLRSECCPDRRLFPRHLLLGAIQEDIVHGPSIFRTDFRQPPVHHQNAERLQKIRFLHWRLAIMIKCFYLPGIEPIDLIDNHYTHIDDPGFGESKEAAAGNLGIRLTPAAYPAYKIDPKSIPFYYYTANDPESILSMWSYEAGRKGRLQFLHSYYSRSEDVEPYSNLCSIKRPFSYEIGTMPFYRIEGHTGIDFPSGDPITPDDLVMKIIDLKNDLNLNFEVYTVKLDDVPAVLTNLFVLDSTAPAGSSEPYMMNPVLTGAEHLGGVERGGTFLIIIGTVTKGGNTMNTVIGDLSLGSKLFLETTPTPTPTPTFTKTPPTPTFTKTPPTATFTKTPPTPTFTKTPPTPTFTKTPPTATFTKTPPTATFTKTPPTPTFTKTPPTATFTKTPPTATFTKTPPTATFTKTLVELTPDSLSKYARALKDKDGLQAINGIGPKMSNYLKEQKISSYREFVDKSESDLKKILDDYRKVEMEVVKDWLAQAALAAADQWEELHQLQQQKKNRPN